MLSTKFFCLLASLRTHLHHWTTKFFSFAGRARLLNSVIFGLTNFWCATVLLPKNIVKVINKLCKDFFWNQEDGDRKLVFKSWSDICSPWNEEGIDIKELLSWNKVVLAKWVWILNTQQEGHWYDWMKAYYFTHDSIWIIQIKDYHSESLKSIITVRDDILCQAQSVVAAKHLLHSWTLNGKFSIAKAYHWFRQHKPILGWAPALHHQFIIPNHMVLTTLALQHKLATLDNLTRRGIYMVNRCILCKSASETHDHLFSTCSFTQKTRHDIHTWLSLTDRSANPTVELNWCNARKRSRHWKNGWLRSSIAATCYQIWHERNARIFQGLEHTAAQLLHLISVCTRISHRVPSADYEQAIQRLNCS
ncbi:uncharacterized protein LOC141607186 [Silene latifolia]|uniref:uncharacterized protein LOC141607186 n=1 Tax=Silene latifolia TaxID=37657 RepID=UPI003D77A76C